MIRLPDHITRLAAGRPWRSRAVTLIEMMIVLTILAIAVLTAIPLMSQTPTARLRSAAQRLQADLAYAQNDSIAHGDDSRVVVFDTVSNGYFLAAVSAPSTPLMHPLGMMDYAFQYGVGSAADLVGVTIASLSVGGDDRVQYGMYGQLDQGTPATITLAAGSRTVTLTIEPDTGDVTVGNIH